MIKALKHLQKFIFRGFLALLPIALSYFVLRFLYFAVDQRVARIIEKWIGFHIPGLGIILVLIILYLLGLAASNWAGRGFFGLIDRISARIPVIKTIYQLGKQIGTAVSLQDKRAFKRVVLVEHFQSGVWSIAFVTGSVEDKKSGERLLKLFIPQSPNPTSGFMAIVTDSQVRELDWSVTEAMNAIISGGLTGPKDVE